jgi:hypothetical protein
MYSFDLRQTESGWRLYWEGGPVGIVIQPKVTVPEFWIALVDEQPLQAHNILSKEAAANALLARWRRRRGEP